MAWSSSPTTQRLVCCAASCRTSRYCAVGVLELVHQDVVEAPLPVGQPLRVLGEERERKQQQIVEIHRVSLLQGGAEGGVDLRRHALQRALGAGAELLGEEHAVLGPGNRSEERRVGKECC